MIAYRCYLLGEDDKIKSAEVIESATDAAALQEAKRRLATCEHPMIEVWDKARRVGIVGHSKDHVGMTAQDRGASIDLSWAQSGPVIEAWRRHYNQIWPHSSLGYLTPPEFIAKEIAASMHATGGDAAVRSARPRPVAPHQWHPDRSLN
jgi:phosphatidylserine/phosphatidylglycerophosphate/cardiolipin synthase-like enzyme